MALKLSIEGLRFRKSDGNLSIPDQLRIVGQRLSNPEMMRMRAGDSAEMTLWQRQPLNLEITQIEVSAVATVQARTIETSEMIDDPRLPFKVARGVVPESLLAGREDAAKMNAQEPGRKIRIPNEKELLKLNEVLGNQLEGKDYGIWTETEHENYPGRYVIRRLSDDFRNCARPGERCYHDAVRFVEDR